MPRPCSVCTHESRRDIDLALVRGASNRGIARHYNIGADSVDRHVSGGHIPAKLAAAEQAAEVANAASLLAEVRGLQDRAVAILDAAEQAGELRTALAAIREARGNLELLARLLGELQDAPQINVHLSAEWLQLQAVVVGALEGHPEARESVLRAIRGAA